jgi:uncharacterized protein YraI
MLVRAALVTAATAAVALSSAVAGSPAGATDPVAVRPVQLAAASTQTFSITGDGVNIRSGPSTVFDVVGIANDGDTLKAQCWSRLSTRTGRLPFIFGQVGGKTGYVAQEFTDADQLIGTLIDACPGAP